MKLQRLIAILSFCGTILHSTISSPTGNIHGDYEKGTNQNTKQGLLHNLPGQAIAHEIPVLSQNIHSQVKLRPSLKGPGTKRLIGSFPGSPIPTLPLSHPRNPDLSIPVSILERQDGVQLPPWLQKSVEDRFDYHEMELFNNRDLVKVLSRRKRDTTYGNDGNKQQLLGQLAYNLGSHNNGHKNQGYGDVGYGGQRYEGQSYEGHNFDGQGYGDRDNGYGYGFHPHQGIKVPHDVGQGYNRGKSPLISFVKSFKPGKTYVDKGHVIRNYYRHGNYNVALQHYKLIPTVKVVPYTSYHKIPFKGHVRVKNKYKAYICKYCYHGYPKIDVYEDKKPYSYMVRRFVYLPKSYNLNSNQHGHPTSYTGTSDGYHGGYQGTNDGYGDSNYGSNYSGYDNGYNHEGTDYSNSGYYPDYTGYDYNSSGGYGSSDQTPSYGYGEFGYDGRAKINYHTEKDSGYGYH